jgi:hypothetical protein
VLPKGWRRTIGTGIFSFLRRETLTFPIVRKEESVKFPGAHKTKLPRFQDEKAFQDLIVRTEIGGVHIRGGSGGHRKMRVLWR